MRLTRRRFLLSAVAAGALGRVQPRQWEWRGSALGAEARIVLNGPRDQARMALSAVVAEIDRLEDIFSLHRASSQLSRLNAGGRLDTPSRDLHDTLAASGRWKRITEGAFDPAVQPLWEHWAQSFVSPEWAALDRVREAEIHIAPHRITLSPETALTLNGIAQGLIADRVSALLTRHGYTPPLVDTGEMRLPGADYRTVDLPVAGLRLSLAETAVATSAPGALRFDGARQRHHLFDPATGDSPGYWRSVTVIAPTAQTADALSTAFAVSSPQQIGDIASTLDDIAVIASGQNGRVRFYGSERLHAGVVHA